MIISTKKLGEDIRKARTERNMSQEQLAKESGVFPKTVSRIELGATFPSLNTLVKIINALKSTNGGSVDEVFYIAVER